MVIAMDNLDLQVRRKRLDLNQRDIARMLPQQVSVSSISDFENGVRDDLPHGQGRHEYDALLKRLERAQERGARKGQR